MERCEGYHRPILCKRYLLEFLQGQVLISGDVVEFPLIYGSERQKGYGGRFYPLNTDCSEIFRECV